ncbi:MAG: flagella basal body P-ring formation protein FlgA [Gemmatimonadales bacterium]|nr:MAG: flagella basal body P-ring formation protein FlgA [Gemmatimonadales bacterium]
MTNPSAAAVDLRRRRTESWKRLRALLTPISALFVLALPSLAHPDPVLALEVPGEEPGATRTQPPALGDPPAAVVAAVESEVARRWSVDAAHLVLEWGAGRAGDSGAPLHVELVGSGAGGAWIVDVTGEVGLERWSFRAGVVTERWTAARELLRGHVLAEEDLQRETVVRWGPPSERGEAPEPGWVTRRGIREGEEVRRPLAAPPELVRPGEPVEVRVRRGAVTLLLVGEARNAGAMHDRIRVRLPTGRMVVGRLGNGGVVEIEHGTDRREDDAR